MDLLGECARRKQEGGREGGRRKFMSMRPDDPETGEAQAHKNALCTPLTNPHFYPSLFLSLILSLSLSLRLPPSLRSRSLMQAAEGHSSLMFWVVVCSCQRSRQPYFLNGGVTEVNKAGWPFTSLHLALSLAESSKLDSVAR